MKKLIITAVILLSCLTFKNANAQISISAGINIGSQPDWGPVGYDNAAYYYMPDIDGYYDVNAHQYIYYENNVWVHRAYLPERYRNYDRYHGYKVVVNERNPWLRNNYYRGHYAQYRGRRDQGVIRDSHDARYANHWKGVDNRGMRQNERANHLNNREQHQDNRAQHLNQREQHQDNRAQHLNQKAHEERGGGDKGHGGDRGHGGDHH